MRSITLRPAIVAMLALAIVNLGFVGTASAGVVATETMISTARDTQAASIQAQLDRAEVRAELAKLGVDKAGLDRRVASLSDSEIASLSRQLQDAPAGGDVIAIIGVVFIVLIILEVVGVIDIFKKNP